MNEIEQAIQEARSNLGNMLAARAEIDEKIIDYRAMLVVLTNTRALIAKREDAEQVAKAEAEKAAADVAEAQALLKAN